MLCMILSHNRVVVIIVEMRREKIVTLVIGLDPSRIWYYCIDGPGVDQITSICKIPVKEDEPDMRCLNKDVM